MLSFQAKVHIIFALTIIEILSRFSEMTAFGESDKKKVLDSMTPDDLKILKEAFTVYDKGGQGLQSSLTSYTDFILRTICCWEFA